MAKKQSEFAYPVHVTEDLFAAENPVLAETLKELAGEGEIRVALVADANVVQRTEGLGSKIGRYFQEKGIRLMASPVVLAGGEKTKADRFQSVIKVANALLEAQIGVDDVVLAMGGGTVLDVAAYAAAQVRGGLRVLRIPTTLEAMFDAAFSEVAMINGDEIKDAFRIAARPAAVLIDPIFTKTVLDGVWRGGFAEAVRLAAVTDAPLMKRLTKRAAAIRNRDEAALRETIDDCLAVRAKKGGTSFALWGATRLESMSGFKIPHGYALAIAICLDCAYAVEKGLLKQADQELICQALVDCGALEGLVHSHHLLSQTESVLHGLDTLRLTTGSDGIVLPAALGKPTDPQKPDREAYAKVIKTFLSASQEA